MVNSSCRHWAVLIVAEHLAVQRAHGTPASYADAIRKLERDGTLPADLAGRLVQAVGFRNLVAHGYEDLDLQRVTAAARSGPADLRAFIARVRDVTQGPRSNG